jgi:hypothetical protein
MVAWRHLASDQAPHLWLRDSWLANMMPRAASAAVCEVCSVLRWLGCVE